MLRRLLPLIALVVLAGSGCTSAPDRAPDTQTTTTTTTTSPTTTSETVRPTAAPAVTEPLDLRRFHDHPCAALSPTQQKQVGFQQFEPAEHESANAQFSNCVWREKPKAGTNDGYGYRISLYMSGDPLAKAYAESNTQDGYHWETFEPRQIGGLPAVVRNILAPDVDCSVVVGTGNGQGLEINGTVTADDPTLCARFTKAAGWIIDAARR